jgi:hypothetical protein
MGVKPTDQPLQLTNYNTAWSDRFEEQQARLSDLLKPRAALALDGGIAGYGHTIVALYAIDASGLSLATTALVLQHRPLVRRPRAMFTSYSPDEAAR